MSIITKKEFLELLEKYPNVLIYFNKFFEEVRNNDISNPNNSIEYKEYIKDSKFNISFISELLEKDNELLFLVTAKYTGINNLIFLKLTGINLNSKFSKECKVIYYDIIESCFKQLNNIL